MRNIFHWKNLLLIIAVFITAISLYQANSLVRDMQEEEELKVKMVVSAIESIVMSETDSSDLFTQSSSTISFATKIIEQNQTIPIIITDEYKNIVSYRNIDTFMLQKDPNYLLSQLHEFEMQHGRILIEAGYGIQQYLYYGDSEMLIRIKQYPVILLSIIAVFFLVILIALSNAQKNIQNQVWVGMSKETAHQLGTPLSSIVGWMEILKDEEANKPYIAEMEKDVERLQLVADRFSKIGSIPQLIEDDVVTRIQKMVNYMQKRAPIHVKIDFYRNESEVEILLVGPLFDWVIENLIRNALDAMEGKGNIIINLVNEPRTVTIDISDTGKGIPKNKFKKIFQPGYSTKMRGWGLGLSLSKRIIGQYHNGSLFVKHSELQKGTTFRIILRR